MTSQAAQPGIFAITLFTQDLEASAGFYETLLASPPIHRDDDSVVFRSGPVLINLLRPEAVPELIAPLDMALSGLRALYTLRVADVDRECDRLAAFGIRPVSGPVDRPRGPRTANVCDPSGHVWELSGAPA